MKIKASWVAFVPLTVGAVLLHIYHLVFLGGDEITQPLFGEYSLLINKSTEPELIVILAAILFVFIFFFSLIDRKTSPYCEIESSPLSGLFIVAAGLLLGVDCAVHLMTGPGAAATNSSAAVNLVGVAAALMFAVIGMGLLVGFSITKKLRLFMLIPTIWSAFCMVNVFINHRKDAPSFSYYDVFAWVFMTLFIFVNSMVLCGIEIKNPVKSSFVYGLMFVFFAAIYSISAIVESMNESGTFPFTELVPVLTVSALGIYALFSLFKLSSCMMTKKKAAELLDDNSAEEIDEEKEEEEDSAPEAAFGVGSTKFVTAEFDKIRLEKAAKKAKERTGNIPNLDNALDDDFENDEEDEPMSTLDKIDQLIMELSEDNNAGAGSAAADSDFDEDEE